MLRNDYLGRRRSLFCEEHGRPLCPLKGQGGGASIMQTPLPPPQALQELVNILRRFLGEDCI
jgi:hypothetical protein